MVEPSDGGTVRSGTIVGGFQIEAVVGRGGMGVVYRARQREPERTVAIKLIGVDLREDPKFRARFQQEASVAARIEHPNVIPVYAVGDDAGLLYIAMRFVDGIDLRTLIAREGRLEPRRATAIIDQVAQALDAAHAQGLVHRDVKPANVLIATTVGREHVYLSDFGLARRIDVSATEGLTGTGALLGTIAYLAPEQIRGEAVDARTDVYALGCVLFHALTGEVPYKMDSDFAMLYAHVTEPPPSVRDRGIDIPPELDAVVRRALAKDSDDRYLSAGDLGRAAVAAAAGAAVSRAEHSVATGAAAPGPVATVPARRVVPSSEGEASTQGAGSTQDAASTRSAGSTPGVESRSGARPGLGPAPESSPRPRASSRLGATGRGRIYALAAAVGILIIIAIVVAVSTGGSGRSHHRVGAPGSAAAGGRQADAGQTGGGQTGGGQTGGGQTGGATTAGIVPGRSILGVALGDARATVLARLRAAGYVTKPGYGPDETDFSSPSKGAMVVDFQNGRVGLIQNYNNDAIKIMGVSVSSTLRQAQQKLTGWKTVRCPKTITLVISPDGHTYFELPHGLDTTNGAGFNGIAVTAGVADKSYC